MILYLLIGVVKTTECIPSNILNNNKYNIITNITIIFDAITAQFITMIMIMILMIMMIIMIMIMMMIIMIMIMMMIIMIMIMIIINE